MKKLLSIKLKPAIKIKTKKGKRYLQIMRVDGLLVHIGPASVLENWKVAFLAIEEEYHALMRIERTLLIHSIAEQGFDPVEATRPIDKGSQKWKEYVEKCNNLFYEKKREIKELEQKFGIKYPECEWDLRSCLERIRQAHRKQTIGTKP